MKRLALGLATLALTFPASAFATASWTAKDLPGHHLLGKAVCVHKVRRHHRLVVRPCPHYREGPRTASWS